MIFFIIVIFLLLLAVVYREHQKQIVLKLKGYDQNGMFLEEARYFESIHGERHFVYASYGLYAYYQLGWFEKYEKLAGQMKTMRAYRRPKFKDFFDKVEENLCCIDFLKDMSTYRGKDIMMLEGIRAKKEHDDNWLAANEELISTLPPLRKYCLYRLFDREDLASQIYKGSESYGEEK